MDLHVQILGRPVKPVAAFIACSLVIIAAFAAIDRGVLDGNWAADWLGGAATVGAAFLAAGWIARSQAIVEYGLAIASWVWGTRLLLVWWLQGPSVEGAWLSACWVGIAAGSYYLERRDRHLHPVMTSDGAPA